MTTTTLDFSSNATDTLSGNSYTISEASGFNQTDVSLDFTRADITLTDDSLYGDVITDKSAVQADTF